MIISLNSLLEKRKQKKLLVEIGWKSEDVEKKEEWEDEEEEEEEEEEPKSFSKSAENFRGHAPE